MRSSSPEPKGKLDAMTGYSFTTPVWDGGAWVTPAVAEVRVAPAAAEVKAARHANGPEDAVPGWEALNWPAHEDNVRRLRQRIFKAVQEGDLARARNLQKLMLRSWSNTLVSVRRATQRNAGRKTAGIDGEVALTAPARMDMAVRVHRTIRSWRPRAVRRVYVPKAGNRAKLRPLGICSCTARLPSSAPSVLMWVLSCWAARAGISARILRKADSRWSRGCGRSWGRRGRGCRRTGQHTGRGLRVVLAGKRLRSGLVGGHDPQLADGGVAGAGDHVGDAVGDVFGD